MKLLMMIIIMRTWRESISVQILTVKNLQIIEKEKKKRERKIGRTPDFDRLKKQSLVISERERSFFDRTRD